jgi:hypothetical protein
LHALHALSLKGELKELVALLGPSSADVNLCAIELEDKFAQQFSINSSLSSSNTISLGEPDLYLYEPAAALLKLQLQDADAAQLGLRKLHPHSHLYTAGHWLPHYFGRGFAIKAVLPYKADAVKQALPGMAAAITARNFPEKPDEIRKKLKLKESSTHYLFATTLAGGQKVLIYATKPEA